MSETIARYSTRKKAEKGRDFYSFYSTNKHFYQVVEGDHPEFPYEVVFDGCARPTSRHPSEMEPVDE